MKTLNLMPDAVQIILPKGKPFEVLFTFSYSITGYTYVSKIIDSNNTVIVTLTCTPNTVSNTVTVTISSANALLIQTGHKWYLQETRSISDVRMVVYGTTEVTQVTDL